MPDPNPPQPDRPCSRCSCPLKFATNASTGKVVPLDLRAPVYLVFRRADGSEFCWSAREFVERSGGQVVSVAPPGRGEVEPVTLTGVHVSHFSTCTDPNVFGRRKAASDHGTV